MRPLLCFDRVEGAVGNVQKGEPPIVIKQEFIQRLIDERLNVMKAIEGLDDDELCKPLAEGKWSAKDTLGHLAAWEGEVVNAFAQKARGEKPTIGNITDFNSWNGVQSEKRKDASPEEVRNELNETRKRLLTFLDALPDEGDVWSEQRSTSKMLNMLIEHDRHHWQGICEHRKLSFE
jgi:uncharacterized damage-inducible protein DinB